MFAVYVGQMRIETIDLVGGPIITLIRFPQSKADFVTKRYVTFDLGYKVLHGLLI